MHLELVCLMKGDHLTMGTLQTTLLQEYFE